VATSPPLQPAQRSRQALALLALGAGAAYLAWRYGFTLRLHSLWLGLPLIAAETWGLVSAALFVFSTWRLTSREPPAPLDGVRVAILVPTYNEPPEILRATLLGALAVRHRPAPEVWVLDDGERAWARAMARELGARYLVRPAPRLHAKAGNLNYALTRVEADFLLVLDADHVPFPHVLERTLGYFRDPRVAFVQSPQAFFNRSFQHPRDADDPLLNEQSLFYDVISPGKDRHNAAFWCGSSAVLRRSALLEVGGVATETVVEDTHTAMRLHQAGWRSVYHHEVLAVGLAPEEVSAFLTQRGRWARGCFQLLRKDNPLLARGLDLRQRLHYFASVSHYLEGPQRLVASLVPAVTLLTGVYPLAADPRLYLTLFLPQLVLVPLATWALARGRYRFLEAERYALVRMGAYTAAAAAFFARGRLPFQVTPKGAQARGVSPVTALRLQLGVLALAAAGTVYQSVAQAAHLPGRLSPFAFAVTVCWSGVSVGLLGWTAVWAARVRHRRRGHRFPVELQVRYRMGDGPELRGARVVDLSPFGLGMDTAEALAPGSRLRLELDLGAEPLSLEGRVVSSRPRRGGGARVGVRFEALAQETEDAIIRFCFSRPFGPRVELGAAPSDETSRPLREIA
jgi:cellulose synthase (UDP-forming)